MATRASALLIGSAVLFALAPATRWIETATLPPGSARSNSPEQVQQRNSSAIGVILGEFRTNLSDMIFIKTERYLDSGVAYAPHIDANDLARIGEADAHEHDHDHEGHDHGPEKHDAETSETRLEDTVTSLDRHLASAEMQESAGIKLGSTQSDAGHDPVATIIKTADQDFRGFIGSLERHVKPWRDPSQAHQHTAGTELLPWYRMATYSDPANARMYMIGAWWLKTLRTPAQVEEALKFLEEGIRNNPGAFQLHVMRGYVLRQLKREAEAKSAFRAAVTKGIQTRPEDLETTSPVWNEDLEEELHAAMLMDVLYVRDTETTVAALQLVTEYASRLKPPNPIERLKAELRTHVELERLARLK